MGKTTSRAITLLFGLAFLPSSYAALDFFAALEVNGVALEVNSSVIMMGSTDVSMMIQGAAFDHNVSKDDRGGITHGDLRIVKRVDKASPLLAQALANNGQIDGVINFFEPDPDTGETRLRFTYTIAAGTITGISPWINNLSAQSAADPFQEAVTIAYTTLQIDDVVNSTSFVYTVN